MNFLPEIVTAPRRVLAGLHVRMSLTTNQTPSLWRSFMQQYGARAKAGGADLFSASVYPAGYFLNFSPAKEFEKWAAAEALPDAGLPADFDQLEIPEGLYAVFQYKGRSSEAGPFYNYIFTQWLPASGYTLALRPHFEILGPAYINDHPESEETVWIPVEPIK